MKRVLLAAQCFPPALTAESVVLLKKMIPLAERFSITLLTLDNRNGFFPQDRDLEHYIPTANLRIIRAPAVNCANPLHRLARGFCKILSGNSALLRYDDLSWVRNALKAFHADVARGSRYDVILSNSHNISAHLVGMAIQKQLRVPWIQHYSDPFSNSPFARYHAVSRRMDRHLEERFFETASFISVPSDRLRHFLFRDYPQDARSRYLNKTIVVPHSYDEAMHRDAAVGHSEAIRRYAPGMINICHAGSLYGPRNMETLLKVDDVLSAQLGKPYRIHLFGHVDRKNLERLQRADRRHILHHGNIGYLESLAVMQASDILLMIDTPLPASPFFPSKLADYLGTDRPIIIYAHGDSAVAAIARETGLCLVDAGMPSSPVILTAQPLDKRKAYSNRSGLHQPLVDILAA